MATEVKNNNEYVVWGKSLPVPSVQEIVRTDSQILPERYIQEQNHRPQEYEFSSDSSEIPIINFSLLASGDEAELRNLDNACKEWGFFYITNHGIAEKVIHDMKKVVSAFFELPIDEKKKYAMEAHDLQGYGQGQVISEEQKLDWCDVLFLQAIPHKNRKLKHWPIESVAGFKEAVDVYTAETHAVAEELISKLSVLMGMDKDGLKKLHQEVKQAIRLNIYPPCTRPDLVLGISPHSDGGTVTLLMQDDDVTALQIKHKDRWVSVKPIPDSFVVNLGDVVELLSNGVYKSIEHRGVTNEKKARMSLATFVFPAEEVHIGPLESMMTVDRPRVYRDIKFMDYIKYTLERTMDGKTHTDFLKLQGA